MAIPFNTTTISILRLPDAALDDEPYQVEVRNVVASGIRAVISLSPQNRGSEVTEGGERSTVKARLTCDPCDLKHTDKVVDAVTEQIWTVEYVEDRQGLGLDHVTAGLIRIAGRL